MTTVGTDPLTATLLFLSLLAEQGGMGPAPGPPGPPGPPAPVPDIPPPMPPPGVLPLPLPVPVPPPFVAPAVVPPPAPAPAPPMPPWPAPVVPAGLPPFPGPGWVADIPVSPAVVARAQYWNPKLWDFPSKTIRQPFVTEQFGGRWLTFRAAWHPGPSGPQTYMSTEAFRLATAPPIAPTPPVVPPPVVPPPAPAPVPVAPVVPPPAPGPVPPPAPVLQVTPLQAAALAMRDALNSHGYTKSDQPLYKAFQSAAGQRTPDGYPGAGTMQNNPTSLRSVLASMALPMPSVPVYPWKAKPGTTGYDGVNAPTWAEWNR